MSNEFEQELTNKIAKEAVREFRQARRWKTFFYSLFALYALFLLIMMFMNTSGMKGLGSSTEGHTALVEIEGVIAANTDARADYVVKGLREAFEDEDTAGIILRINSPGGSPVQAGYINDEINRLKGLHPEIPVYAVVADICASGGYYIAVAADEIYADKASIVGSIGVIMAGFGFVDAIEKLGVERRLITAGENKAFMDPFSPSKQSHIDHIDGLINQVHQQFIDVVKEGRGSRLHYDDSLFTGLVWTGEESEQLGLIDGLGSSSYVARELIGVEDIVNFTHKTSPLDQFAKHLGASFGSSVLSQLEVFWK